MLITEDKSYMYQLCSFNVFLRCLRLTKENKKGGKDQETIQSSTTPDPGYHMGK